MQVFVYRTPNEWCTYATVQQPTRCTVKCNWNKKWMIQQYWLDERFSDPIARYNS